MTASNVVAPDDGHCLANRPVSGRFKFELMPKYVQPCIYLNRTIYYA